MRRQGLQLRLRQPIQGASTRAGAAHTRVQRPQLQLLPIKKGLIPKQRSGIAHMRAKDPNQRTQVPMSVESAHTRSPTPKQWLGWAVSALVGGY